MPYYKDNTNKVYFLDDAKFSNILPKDCVAITEDEAKTLAQEITKKYIEDIGLIVK